MQGLAWICCETLDSGNEKEALLGVIWIWYEPFGHLKCKGYMGCDKLLDSGNENEARLIRLYSITISIGTSRDANTESALVLCIGVK
jgi:hypothetical protein